MVRQTGCALDEAGWTLSSSAGVPGSWPGFPGHDPARPSTRARPNVPGYTPPKSPPHTRFLTHSTFYSPLSHPSCSSPFCPCSTGTASSHRDPYRAPDAHAAQIFPSFSLQFMHRVCNRWMTSLQGTNSLLLLPFPQKTVPTLFPLSPKGQGRPITLCSFCSTPEESSLHLPDFWPASSRSLSFSLCGISKLRFCFLLVGAKGNLYKIWETL